MSLARKLISRISCSHISKLLASHAAHICPKCHSLTIVEEWASQASQVASILPARTDLQLSVFCCDVVIRAAGVFEAEPKSLFVPIPEIDMNSSPPWFERRFDFSFPVELLPNLCARLRGTPARLRDVLREVPEQRLMQKPRGTWSAQENAGHLVDLEPLWLARVGDYVKGSHLLTPTDLQNRKTDEAKYNDRELESILTEFCAARKELMKQVQELDHSHFRETLLHPRLKVSMRLLDHLYFIAEHDDHHLARIWNLIANDF